MRFGLIAFMSLALASIAGCGEDSKILPPAVPDTVSVSFQDGVAPTGSYRGTSDAVIKDGPSNGFRNGNFGTEDADTVGSVSLSTGYYERRLLVRFDLSSIRNCSQVLSATLSIRIVGPASGTIALEAHRILQLGNSPWTEGTGGIAQGVSWTTVDGEVPWTVEGGDFDAAAMDAQQVSPGDTIVSFSLAPAVVKGWISSPASNHGVIVLGDNLPPELFTIASMREDLVAVERPRLDLSYLKGP